MKVRQICPVSLPIKELGHSRSGSWRIAGKDTIGAHSPSLLQENRTRWHTQVEAYRDNLNPNSEWHSP